MKIVTVSCDLYADTAPAFAELIRTKWPGCAYDVVFVTNNKPLEVTEPVYYLNKREDAAFGWRMRQFIRHHYTEPYLLFMMSDYFIKSVDPVLVAQAHELCSTPQVRHVRLRPMPHPQMAYDMPGFGRIDKRKRYSLSLQPGIWETQVLYDLLSDNENPWASEINGSIRAKEIPGLFLSTTVPAITHVNYFNKGTPQSIQWVRDNVSPEHWPEGVK